MIVTLARKVKLSAVRQIQSRTGRKMTRYNEFELELGRTSYI